MMSSYNFENSNLLLTGAMSADNLNQIPISTQNYTEKYRELEKVREEEKRNNDELKECYKLLKLDYTRFKNLIQTN
jgi:hypothetical protein